MTEPSAGAVARAREIASAVTRITRIVRDEHGALHDIRDVDIAALARALHEWGEQAQAEAREAKAAVEIAEEKLAIARKIRAYISFVLAGDENADSQLAADHAKARIQALERALVDLVDAVKRRTTLIYDERPLVQGAYDLVRDLEAQANEGHRL